MLTVSLHGIHIHAPYGLYPEERLLLNEFIVDVDVLLPHDNVDPWPFVDYTMVNGIVQNVFQQPAQLIENLVQNIHTSLKEKVPQAEKIKVCIKKLHPPMPGQVEYARVCYEA